MNYIDKYTNKRTFENLLDSIKKRSSKLPEKVNLMEVCGTHTVNIGRSGIRKIIPQNINLLSGPGCPVCVTSVHYIKTAIELGAKKDTMITTFGDMLRVPDNKFRKLSDLSSDKVRMVYSPLDSINIAKDNPQKNVIFLGVGFETTAPVVAQTVKYADTMGLKNFFMLSAHKVIPPALKILAGNKSIQGYILPGHVSVIIGEKGYKGIDMNGAITGFETIEILLGIDKILENIIFGKMVVENQYKWAVTKKGNGKMQSIMKEVFEHGDSFWRGFLTIKNSGLFLNKKFERFDAYKRFDLSKHEDIPENCVCSEIIMGEKNPKQCPMFAKKCTPETPYGPCMVSTEGACSAYYKYER